MEIGLLKPYNRLYKKTVIKEIFVLFVSSVILIMK